VSGCSASHSEASARSLRTFAGTTASTGAPNASPRLVLTSQKTTASPSSATMSSSPVRQRQLRSSTRIPASVSVRAATRSPYAPTASLAPVMSPTVSGLGAAANTQVKICG